MGIEGTALLEYSNDRTLPDEIAPCIPYEGRPSSMDGLVGGQVLLFMIIEVPDVEGVRVVRPAPELVPSDGGQAAADVAFGTRDCQEVIEEGVEIAWAAGAFFGINPQQAGAGEVDREEDGEDV